MTRSRRFNLCIVAHSSDLYGADRCLHAVLPELLERFDVTVAVPSPGPGVALMRELGATVLLLPDYALRRRHLTPRGFLPWLRRIERSTRILSQLHRDHPFDAVYSNTLAAGIGPLLRLRWRVPHAVHIHECPNEPRWLPGILVRIIGWSSQLVICNSNYSAGWVRRIRPTLADRTVVIYNGLDLVAPPAVAPPTHEPFTIACVARIHPKKGQTILFEALRMAKETGRAWKLELFGDTLSEYLPLYDQLVDFARQYDLVDAVEWRGFVGDVQIQYADADLAVVPSVIPEEFSLVCLEAQSMLLPVIATGPGGASEVVADGETGMIVPPNDPKALFDAICTLQDNPQRRAAMGRAGRARAEELFTRSAFAVGVRDALTNLCSAEKAVQ